MRVRTRSLAAKTSLFQAHQSKSKTMSCLLTGGSGEGPSVMVLTRVMVQEDRQEGSRRTQKAAESKEAHSASANSFVRHSHSISPIKVRTSQREGLVIHDPDAYTLVKVSKVDIDWNCTARQGKIVEEPSFHLPQVLSRVVTIHSFFASRVVVRASAMATPSLQSVCCAWQP